MVPPRAGCVRIIDLLVGSCRDVVQETVVVASRVREESNDFAVIVQAQGLRKRGAGKLKEREYAAVVQESLEGGRTGQVKSDNHSRIIDVRGLPANPAGRGYWWEWAGDRGEGQESSSAR